MGFIPESREARYSVRGKPTTSHYRALRVAEQTLVIRKVEPSLRSPVDVARIREEIIARNFKPQRPEWLQKLDQRPFQSKDDFLRTLETDYVPEKKEKLETAKKVSKKAERELAFSHLLDLFADV